MAEQPGRSTGGGAPATIDIPAADGMAAAGAPNPFDLGSVANALKGRGDIALALGVVFILIVLILPMPAWLLDFSLAISITLSVLILMTALFISRPLEFSSFPTVLLIATMLRLSLNLASTRLILADGHEGTQAAGAVIQAFGNFVMGGNFVIGIIVFAILVIVNFIVITKGSGRIAEVAARFSLDAMPGKQMAIDADLSAGLIDEAQARQRRKDVEDESTFFGSMDGAAKFVRGDAIAGLLITFINVIAGIIIGTAQMDMSLADASRSYTLLTVGDGLVSQIPALIVSTAAGMLVSKAGATGSTDKILFSQLGGYPSAMGLSAVLMAALGLLPGIPMVPFFGIAAVAATASWAMGKRQAAGAADNAASASMDEAGAPVAEEPIGQTLKLDDIRLELGYGLLGLVNGEAGPMVTDQVKGLRKQLANEMGFVMPAVRIQDNMQLPTNGYAIMIKEIEAGSGELQPNMLMIMDPRGEELSIAGEDTTEPAFGLPARWVDDTNREEAAFRGYTVVDPATVIATHMTEIIRDNMSDLLSFAETQKLLDDLDPEYQKLIADLVPGQISVGGIQRVLKNLLRERVSIRDLPNILEGISEVSGTLQNVTMITEHVRARLARQISDSAANGGEYVPLVTLSPEWEQAFADSVLVQGEERHLSMQPSQLQDFIAKTQETLDRISMTGETPVLLTSPQIRSFVRSIIERVRPTTQVISQNEIHPKVRIRTLGQV